VKNSRFTGDGTSLLYSCFGSVLFRLNDVPLLYEDIKTIAGVAGSLRWKHVHEIADFPFFTHVGDDAPVGIGIKARQVAGIGVAVGVAVGDFKQEEEVVTVGQYVVAHRFVLVRG
jgi:hypothetical protein